MKFKKGDLVYICGSIVKITRVDELYLENDWMMGYYDHEIIYDPLGNNETFDNTVLQSEGEVVDNIEDILLQCL